MFAQCESLLPESTASDVARPHVARVVLTLARIVGTKSIRSLILQSLQLAVLACGIATALPVSSQTLSISRYYPLSLGNQWTYKSDTLATSTISVGSPVVLQTGVAASPVQRVSSNESGYSVSYMTNDGSGLREYQTYVSRVPVPGYGDTSATATMSPAVTMAPAVVALGSTYTSSGNMTFDYANVVVINANYISSSKIVGMELVRDYYGTRSWQALKVVTTVTVRVNSNGQTSTITSVATNWFAEGVGTVQFSGPNSSGTVETWKLTSTNVVPAPAVLAPAAPTSVVANPGNGQVTVSFAAPVSDGGSAITGYTVTSNPSGGVDINAGSTSTTHTITGLTNGVTYVFTVKAANLVGTSVASGPSNSVAPMAPPAPPGGASNFQGMWWASPANSEPGWGINFAHQSDTLFATWFTFGVDGKPLWLVAAATKTSGATYSGRLYTGTGPAFYSVPFDPSKVVAMEVGSVTFTFANSDSAAFTYTVNGMSQTKQITREQFGSSMPTCVWGNQPNLAVATNYQDMWWAAPPNAEPGWGINFAHQGDAIFATWFTFDFDGKPLWLVTGANKVDSNTYSGTLYTGTGPAYNSAPYDPAKVTPIEVGTATFTFSDGNNASFAYTVSGITQTKPITRQVFSSAGTVCH